MNNLASINRPRNARSDLCIIPHAQDRIFQRITRRSGSFLMRRIQTIAAGTGGGQKGAIPHILPTMKFKSLKITTYKSVYINKAKNMLIIQWILKITDILMYKIVSFLNISVIKNFLHPPPIPKNVPTALQTVSLAMRTLLLLLKQTYT